jgi:hypothetical protein
MKKRILIVSLLFLVNNMFAQSKLVTKWNPYTQSYETTYEEDYYEKRERERKEEERKSRQSLEESDRRFNETLNKYIDYRQNQSQRYEELARENRRYLANITKEIDNKIFYLMLNCTVDINETVLKYNEFTKRRINFIDNNDVESAAMVLNNYLSYFSNYPCNKK